MPGVVNTSGAVAEAVVAQPRKIFPSDLLGRGTPTIALPAFPVRATGAVLPFTFPPFKSKFTVTSFTL